MGSCWRYYAVSTADITDLKYFFNNKANILALNVIIERFKTASFRDVAKSISWDKSNFKKCHSASIGRNIKWCKYYLNNDFNMDCILWFNGWSRITKPIPEISSLNEVFLTVPYLETWLQILT